jgi:hypothetical protein
VDPDFLLQPANTKKLKEMATRVSFAIIVVFKGFGNGAISFAYASRILAGNQP